MNYKTIDQIRKENLRLVIHLNCFSQTEIAKLIKTSHMYISQILSKKTKATLGTNLARRIEENIGLPCGWMDNLHEPCCTGTYAE